MKTPDIIIFGVGNYNSLGVLHCLGAAGISAFILCVGSGKDIKNGNIILYSKWAKQFYIVNNEEEGIEWLYKNKNLFHQKTVIIPTSDKVEKLLDQNLAILSDHFNFPNALTEGRVAELMDKRKQMELAEKAGIRLLRSQYTNSIDFSFEKVRYPCMVKPLDSTAGSKGDMRVCGNKGELREAITTGKNTKDFIVQQYIRNEADLLFLGIALKGENPWIPAVVVKPGVSPTGEYTHAIVSTDVDHYLDQIKEVNAFIRGLNFSGPFSIEFGLEKGRTYFFEINLRNDGTSHYPLNLGVNLAERLYRSYQEGRIARQEVERKEYEMIDETGDTRRILNGEISLTKWTSSFKNAGTYRFYQTGDYPLIYPLTRMFMRRFFGKLARIFH